MGSAAFDRDAMRARAVAAIPRTAWLACAWLGCAWLGCAGPGDAADDGAHATTDAAPTATHGGAASTGSDAGSAATASGDPSDGAVSDGAVDGGSADSGGDDGLGPAEFDEGELDDPSNGGTITFTQIGAAGWYPSRRDPAIGPCDAYEADGCCMAQHEVTGDHLTPWDEDLVLTLRGPMLVEQLAVYGPAGDDAGDWRLVSGWTQDVAQGVTFDGGADFDGAVGTECLVDVATDRDFPCGAGSEPYCPPSSDPQHLGFAGSKLFVVLASMPHVDERAVGEPCSASSDGNWWDAPWIGLSLGELARAGAFSDCQCYAKNPEEWWLGDGCGQFNVFEVVNDNNEFRNLDVFSTNFFGYAGYVGEGPCGAQCDVSALAPEVDLIDKAQDAEAAAGAEASPTQGPGAAFRRPTQGYRYFLILMDAGSRTVQLAVVHPLQIPASVGALLPALPFTLPRSAVDALLDLRLPQ